MGASDVLIYQGPDDELAMVQELVSALDVAPVDVVIRATVFEVQTSKKDSSAVQLALSILGGKLTAAAGAVSNATVSFKSGGFAAAVELLASDSRFKLVSSPSLRVLSGQSARVSVGSDVPVLGAVTVPGPGVAPIQSVSYQSSGVILEVSPVVLVDRVQLTLSQEISNFEQTLIGVNGSPTLLKRQLRSVVSLSGSEAALLGGLSESSATNASQGVPFFPRVLWSKSSGDERTELLVMVSAERLEVAAK